MERTLWACVVALAMAGTLQAQAPASVAGFVIDPSGAAVPGARVAVSGPGGSARLITDDTGAYAFRRLPPGAYIIRVAAPGFSFFESMIELTAARPATMDAKLQLAADRQEITVADTIQEDLKRSKNDGEMVVEAPYDRVNDLDALAAPPAGRNESQVFIDGFSNGQPTSKDSIREIRVTSNPFSAEFDRVGYGRVEILPKPGADRFHGSILFQSDTSALDARNPFANVKSPFLSRQFGGNVAGAINRKTSFFVDVSDRYEDDRGLIRATVPVSNSLPVLFTQNIPAPVSWRSVSPRIDYQAGATLTLQARYTWTGVTSVNAGAGGFNLASQSVNMQIVSHSAQLTGTWAVNDRVVNESRFQYTRSARSQDSVNNIPTMVVSGFFTGSGAAQGPQYTNQGSYEFQNYTSVTRGTHQMKFGLRLRFIREDDFNATNFNGVFRFASLNDYMATVRGQAFKAVEYLLGSGNPLLHVKQTDVGPFIQDDWRIIPSLTLSMGLRYETQSNIHDEGNFAPRLGLAWAPGTGRVRQPKTVFRAGFGFFYDRFPLEQVLHAERLDGVIQQDYVWPNPPFFLRNIPSPSSLATVLSSARYRIDPGLAAPRIVQSAIGVERQLPGDIALSVNYADSRGLHQLRTRALNGSLPGSGRLYQYESSGMFKQNQLTVQMNARLRARYSMFGFYTLAHAHSNTDGVDTFPANSYDVSSEWSRAQFDVRHRFLIGGNLSMPLGIRLSPVVTFASAPPFNIVVGEDLNGDSVFNDRPTLASASSIAASNRAVAAGQPPFVFATPYGVLNARPAPGEPPIPRNFGQGFGSFSINLRVGRTWGFGEPAGGSFRNNGREADGFPRSGGFRGFAGGRPDGGGDGGFLASAATDRRYNLTASIEVRNLLNSVNPDAPVGILGSPQFGQALGMGQNTTQSANRRIELQLRFSF